MDREEFDQRYDRAKTKFYANPIFAAQAGIVVGVAGTLFLQWLF